MIVDDATVMRMRLRDILEPRYQVVAEAANGVEALELYKKVRPDFVTLDITMPQLNGLAALRNLLTADPEARVVIVSAVGQKQVVFQALAQGAKDFIVKPFEAERVMRAVDRLFA
jgi:two-component system chemotaxis response regulator CheY